MVLGFLVEVDPLLLILRHVILGEDGVVTKLFVEEGGCSGLQYGMVFDEKRDDDRALEFFGETVLVDDFSVNYLRGAVVDYSDGLNDAGFKIKNPNAKQSCGCGNSFET